MSLPSNWSLRFPRTAREAYGYDISFHGREGYATRAALIVVGVLAGFILGVAL